MILVPRPAPHLPRTLAALHDAGFTNLLPLALSQPEPLPVSLPPAITALILTNRFGIPKNISFRHLPTYCVGGCTSIEAKKQGFNVVYTGTNNGVTMAQNIFEQHLKPTHFAHLHGDHAGMEWHAILKLAGHNVTPILAYQTRRITALPAPIVKSLQKTAALPLTLLFSAGSASHLANLLKQVNIQPIGTAICFSPVVALAAGQHWPQVVTCAKPTLGAMVATIRRLAR